MTQMYPSERSERQNPTRFLLATALSILIGFYTQTVTAETVSFHELPTDARTTISKILSKDLPDPYAIRVEGDDDFRTENPSHGLTIKFDEQWVSVRRQKNRMEWRIRLTGIGYGETQPVAPPILAFAGNRMEYRRGDALTEWYLNTPSGLEQGFTLSKPPGNRGRGQRLRLEMVLSGNLTASVRNEKALVLSDASGRESLRYAGLTVLDADGKELPARLSVTDNRLRIDTNDTDARYPIIIDPWIQDAMLTASDGTEWDEFGQSVSINGETIVIGGYSPDSGQSAVYVFQKSGGFWEETGKLVPSDGTFGNGFGSSVSIDLDSVVVGAYGQDQSSRGAAYIFVKPDTGWTDMAETAKLTASDVGSYDYFGRKVAISSETVVVGSYNHDTLGNSNQGAAYVFVKPGDNWTDMTETAKLSASDGAANDWFGASASIDGDVVVVGASGHDISGSLREGAAYIFEKPAAGWRDMTETAKLTASDYQEDSGFGWSVSINGDTIVVGAYEQDIDFGLNQGAAYVFQKSGANWSGGTETAKLFASNGNFTSGDKFGNSLSISGDTVVIGTHLPFLEGGDTTGVAYVFKMPSTGWIDMTETTQLTAQGFSSTYFVDCSVSVHEDTVVVGASQYRVGINSDQGAAFVISLIDDSAFGDVNGDDVVDLADALLVLRFLSGAETANLAIDLDADVDGDDRLGVHEAIYILQTIAGDGKRG